MTPVPSKKYNTYYPEKQRIRRTKADIEETMVYLRENIKVKKTRKRR